MSSILSSSNNYEDSEENNLSTRHARKHRMPNQDLNRSSSRSSMFDRRK
ncbi:19766_t:CDS:2, partial [Dentiscutata erythropus]